MGIPSSQLVIGLTRYVEPGTAESTCGRTASSFTITDCLVNPSRAPARGVVCGVRLGNIEGPTMREIRYLDKLIDELARGKEMEEFLRR
jgi:hypothetical protein